MTITECIKNRRSIRKYKPDPVDHSILESVVSAASYSPSWKNTQVPRFIAIEDPVLKETIAARYVPDFNAHNIRQAPILMAVTYVVGRSGFERDGSFTTRKGDRWQMFDVGAACQTFCLAATQYGLGTVIMGMFEEDEISDLIGIPHGQELGALIALGYPDPDLTPRAPRRKPVEEILQYR